MSTEATSGAAAEQPRRRMDELLATLADRIGARFSAASVYGTPIERDGVTVVPVAAARFGIGAGGGSDPSKGQDGEGGGAGGGVTSAGLHRAQGRSQPFRARRPPAHDAIASALLATTPVCRSERASDARLRRRSPAGVWWRSAWISRAQKPRPLGHSVCPAG